MSDTKHEINPLLRKLIIKEIVLKFNDIIQWDRWSVNTATDSGFIYGWIPREKGGLDFAIFQFWLREGRYFTTEFNSSSAKYSQVIADRLNAANVEIKSRPYLECCSCKELEGANLVKWQR